VVAAARLVLADARAGRADCQPCSNAETTGRPASSIATEDGRPRVGKNDDSGVNGGSMARKKKSRPSKRLSTPADYAEFLDSLKQRVRQAQTKAMLTVNRELIGLYWDIGRRIVERQEREGWGKSVVDRLAADIQKAFPGIRGFSPINIWRMRAFFLAYRDIAANLSQVMTETGSANLSQAVTDLAAGAPPPSVAAIPWGQNQVLLFKTQGHRTAALVRR
jgi:hypothetical protein